MPGGWKAAKEGRDLAAPSESHSILKIWGAGRGYLKVRRVGEPEGPGVAVKKHKLGSTSAGQSCGWGWGRLCKTLPSTQAAHYPLALSSLPQAEALAPCHCPALFLLASVLPATFPALCLPLLGSPRIAVAPAIAPTLPPWDSFLLLLKTQDHTLGASQVAQW